MCDNRTYLFCLKGLIKILFLFHHSLLKRQHYNKKEQTKPEKQDVVKRCSKKNKKLK